jgi:hypothetical protein
MSYDTVNRLRDVLIGIQQGGFNHDELNTVIEAVKFARAQNAKRAARTLNIGDQVVFNGRRGVTVGVLEKINIKKAIVKVGDTRWNVPLAMLEAA